MEINTEIYFDDFPDWDHYPSRGYHAHSDSAKFEIELSDETFEYYVICEIDVDYSRVYHPETFWDPEYDEVSLDRIKVWAQSGYMTLKDDDTEMPLSASQLEDIEKYLTKNLIINE